jgi:glyoxylate reductase
VKRPTVVITSELPEIAGRILSRDFEVIVHPTNGRRSEDDLITILSDADGAITLLTDPVTRRVLASNPHLRVIGNYAVGLDNVDLDAAHELGVVVTHTPEVLTDATADLTMALILAVTRHLVEGDQIMRRGAYPGWQPLYLLGHSLQGKTLGIIGMGRIGRAVAARAGAFGMEICCSSHSSNDDGVRRVPLEELLRGSDIVSIHCPLNPETHHLINAESLSKMKGDAYLINTARGAIVDESALADALASGRIAGAGLDVYEHEPWVDLRLVNLPNVVLLPHLGSNTLEARAEMARLVATDVAAVLHGRQPANEATRKR